jgi:integrase
MLDFSLEGIRQRPVVRASAQTISQVVGAVDGALLQIRLGLTDSKALLTMIAKLQGRDNTLAPRIDDCLIAGIQASGGSEKTRRDYASAANNLITWLKENHPRVVLWRDLSPALVHAFFMAHRDRSRKGMNHLLCPLRLAVKNLKRIDPGCHDPLAGFELPAAQKASPRKPALDVVELKSFLEKVPSHVLGPIVCMAMLGLRPSEASTLTVADIDLARGLVHVRANDLASRKKTLSSVRTLPMPACLIPYLQATIQPGEPQAPAFGKVHDLSQWWKRTRHKFEMPDGFSIYALRGTFASICYGAGCDAQAVATYMGHAQTGDRGTAVLESHYLHVTKTRLVQVAEAFHRVFGNVLATVVAA